MIPSVADSVQASVSASVDRTRIIAPRHRAFVRITHWITTLCFFALLVSGVETLTTHPRFYWGEAGNILTPPLFRIPIPAARSAVPTAYGFVLTDQNGWARSLHFQSGWILVFTGLLYTALSLYTGHLRRNLLPRGVDFAPRTLSAAIISHLRFARPAPAEAWAYNALQRFSYLFVIFVAFPLVIWTGLAMSPAIVSAYPWVVTTFGGQQSARTIHFFISVFLVLFVIVHVLMVYLAGFGSRLRAMVTGRIAPGREQS